MASISSTTLTPSLRINPSTKFTSLSSTSSVCFTQRYAGRAGISLNRATNYQNRRFTCKSLFGLGVPELVVIAGVAALVFGPKKLPEVGRSFGKTIKSFQQAAKEFESELKKDGEPSGEPETEQITAVDEEAKQEVKIPSTKESS